jgi:nuclease HARBI1
LSNPDSPLYILDMDSTRDAISSIVSLGSTDVDDVGNVFLYDDMSIIPTIVSQTIDLLESSDTDNDDLLWTYDSSGRVIQNYNDHNNIVHGLRYMNFDDQHFKTEFRITKQLFNDICSNVQRILHPTGRKPIDIRLRCAIFIKKLATGQDTRSLSTRFGVSVGSTSRIISQFTRDFYATFNHLIQFANESTRQRTKHHFLFNYSLPHIVGCVDGSHILLFEAPKSDPVSYYNRKQTHSSILHAMCDEQLMIRDVNFGWPGSVADSTIYNTSQLKHLLGSMNNAMVLGDSAYQLSSSVLTPFPQSYTTAQHIRYNTKHAAGRVYIERCFALLKNTWRILKCLTIEWSETAIKAVG